MLCECDETAVNVTTCFILSYYLSLDIHNKDYFCFCLTFQLHFIAFQIHCCLQFIPFLIVMMSFYFTSGRVKSNSNHLKYSREKTLQKAKQSKGISLIKFINTKNIAK